MLPPALLLGATGIESCGGPNGGGLGAIVAENPAQNWPINRRCNNLRPPCDFSCTPRAADLYRVAVERLAAGGQGSGDGRLRHGGLTRGGRGGDDDLWARDIYIHTTTTGRARGLGPMFLGFSRVGRPPAPRTPPLVVYIYMYIYIFISRARMTESQLSAHNTAWCWKGSNSKAKLVATVSGSSGLGSSAGRTQWCENDASTGYLSIFAGGPMRDSTGRTTTGCTTKL